MADTTSVLLDGPRHLSILMTNDGSTETNAVKIDRDATSHTNGTDGVAGGSLATVPRKTLDKLALEEIWWSIDGFDNVILSWDFSTDETMMVLAAGEGLIQFQDNGVRAPNTARGGTATDGDVLLTTPTAAGTENYTIKARFRKKWVD